MAENLIINQAASRGEKYRDLLPQLKALVSGEPDLIANVANIVAAIRETFGFLWVGVYFVKGDQLVLGPFQGPIACTRIAYGKGVCGRSWSEKKVFVVEDVDRFPGHIACSSSSRSEIVLPVLGKDGNVAMVLDIDSEHLADFSSVDEQFLTQVTELIESMI
ncbi:MAG: GAF domain-containing protein [Flavobacteriales bacterium]|nr:GAF domain-containing protein [Flavobacteriales bacterium]MCB9449752.1 GAF domain-containing protein [Flavobacteriales bacterium]